MKTRARMRLQHILIAMTFAASAVQAAGRVDVDRVLACADERDDARRLACYDGAVERAKPPAEVSAISPPLAPVAPEAPPSPVKAAASDNEFGIDGSAIARQRDAEKKASSEVDEPLSIAAEVTQISSRPRGEIVFSLDNGQVWVQKKSQPNFPIKTGDRIAIKAGALGSFYLVNGKRSTQVTRVK